MEFHGPAWLLRSATVIGTTATVVALALLYLEFSGRLDAFDSVTYLWVDTILCSIMLAEWFVLLYYVDDRRKYIKARWIDFVAAIPLLLIFRPFRVLRLVRLLRLLRGIALVRHAMRPWEKAMDMTLLKSVGMVAAAMILICAAIVMDLERENPALNTYDQAIWWAVVTASTVGYGDIYPVTGPGRFVAVVLMIVGIGVFGTLAATLTNALTLSRKKKATIEDVMERLDGIETRLDEVIERTRRE